MSVVSESQLIKGTLSCGVCLSRNTSFPLNGRLVTLYIDGKISLLKKTTPITDLWGNIEIPITLNKNVQTDVVLKISVNNDRTDLVSDPLIVKVSDLFKEKLFFTVDDQTFFEPHNCTIPLPISPRSISETLKKIPSQETFSSKTTLEILCNGPFPFTWIDAGNGMQYVELIWPKVLLKNHLANVQFYAQLNEQTGELEAKELKMQASDGEWISKVADDTDIEYLKLTQIANSSFLIYGITLSLQKITLFTKKAKTALHFIQNSRNTSLIIKLGNLLKNSSLVLVRMETFLKEFFINENVYLEFLKSHTDSCVQIPNNSLFSFFAMTVAERDYYDEVVSPFVEKSFSNKKLEAAYTPDFLLLLDYLKEIIFDHSTKKDWDRKITDEDCKDIRYFLKMVIHASVWTGSHTFLSLKRWFSLITIVPEAKESLEATIATLIKENDEKKPNPYFIHFKYQELHGKWEEKAQEKHPYYKTIQSIIGENFFIQDAFL